MTAEQERAAIVAELRKRIAEAWENEVGNARTQDVTNAVLWCGHRFALESAADYIEAGKHRGQPPPR